MPGLEPREVSPSGIVGVIVNPAAGKDIRRLATAASHTSDVAKVGIVKRCVIAAVEAGAERVLLSADYNHLAERATEGIDGPIELLASPATGSRLDSLAAARDLWKADAGAVIVLGGDGTCRDVAIGWPQAPMLPISTGTNNVFPRSLDGTSAGTAAALIARGIVPLAKAAHQAQRVVIEGDDIDETALVEVALIDADFVGARAVQDGTKVKAVVACIADPATTGLSSLAGPDSIRSTRSVPGGVAIETGAGDTSVRVPLSPGAFTSIDIAAMTRLQVGDTFAMTGPGILAFDGERDLRLNADQTVHARVSPDGPWVIDVDQTLRHPSAATTFVRNN